MEILYFFDLFIFICLFFIFILMSDIAINLMEALTNKD